MPVVVPDKVEFTADKYPKGAYVSFYRPIFSSSTTWHSGSQGQRTQDTKHRALGGSATQRVRNRTASERHAVRKLSNTSVPSRTLFPASGGAIAFRPVLDHSGDRTLGITLEPDEVAFPGICRDYLRLTTPALSTISSCRTGVRKPERAACVCRCVHPVLSFPISRSPANEPIQAF